MFGPLQTHHVQTAFGSWDVEKVHAVVAQSTCPRQKTEGFGALLDVQVSFCVACAGDCAPCQNWAKRAGSAAVSKTMASVGHLKRICKDAFSVAGSTRGMFIRDIMRSGRWFPERGCILEHQIFRFAKMILRDTCSTSFDLASLVCGQRGTLDRRSGTKTQKALVWGSQLSIFEEVSQNCFVFDVAKFKNWGTLAEFPWFWCCQVQESRKSRRLAALLMLPSSKMEEA